MKQNRGMEKVEMHLGTSLRKPQVDAEPLEGLTFSEARREERRAGAGESVFQVRKQFCLQRVVVMFFYDCFNGILCLRFLASKTIETEKRFPRNGPL